MKTGLYLCCVVVALFAEVSSQDQGVLNEPVDKRGLYLESAQSQNAAAAAGKQSSSYLNVDGGYPSQNYLGSAQQAQPQYSAPGGWSGADGSLQFGQQSSESAIAHASSNQFSKLIADGAYGEQAANQYPQYLPSGLSSLPGQLSQSGAAASASAQSSGSQYQGLNGNSYYPTAGNSQYLQQAQAEASGSAQAGSSNLFDQQLNFQAPAQRQLNNLPQDYGSLVAAGPFAGSLGGSSLGGSGGGASGLSQAGASASASSKSFQSQENPLVPRLKCGYVRQCKTVLEPAVLSDWQN